MARTPDRTPIYAHLYFQVLIGILLGVVVGYVWPKTGAALRPLGNGFIKLIRMMIAPIIFSTVVVGIAKMGDMKSVGRIGIRALVYFEIVSTLALLIGLLIINLLQPGVGINADPATLDARAVAAYTTNAQHLSTVDFLLNIIPTTVVDAFAKGEILQVLLFSVLFGLALLRVGERGRMLVGFLEQFSHVLFSVVGIIMRVAPIGAFGAMSFTIGQYGIGALFSLGKLMASFYATCLVFIIFVLGGIAAWTGFSLFKFIRYIKEEILIALGTSSSDRRRARGRSGDGRGCQALKNALGCRAVEGAELDGGNGFTQRSGGTEDERRRQRFDGAAGAAGLTRGWIGS